MCDPTCVRQEERNKAQRHVPINYGQPYTLRNGVASHLETLQTQAKNNKWELPF